jgi:hypothetical protein
MDEPRKKRSTKRCVLAADPLNIQLAGPLPDFGKLPGLQFVYDPRQLTTVTTGRKSKRNHPLVAAIEKRLRLGGRPPAMMRWKQFCDVIRDDCDAWIGVPKRGEPKRGFSDDSIERVAREIMKSS